MSKADKILAVLGSDGTGKATTIGNLIYKCGGIDMPTLERLEKGRNNGYARAFNEIKARNENLYFYTPENKITVTEDLSKAHGLLLIITPHETDKQLQMIGNQLKGMASHKKMLVLVNKLDEVNWSEDAFTDSVRVTNTVLQSLGVSKEQILFIPASGLCSDNLLELSSSLPWYSKITESGKQRLGKAITVVAALDFILS